MAETDPNAAPESENPESVLEITPLKPELEVAPPEPAPPAPEPPAPAPKPDWREKQLGKVRGQNKELASRVAELEAELAPFKAQQQPKPAPGLSQADVERLANERAQQIAAEAQFARDVNAVVESGKTAFADWDARMNDLGQIVEPTDVRSTSAYAAMVQAAISTGAGHHVLYSLSGDPAEASRIMELPPVQMGIELAKLALNPPKDISGAPKPIRPINGANASRSEIRPDDPERADGLPTAEWMRRRQAQSNARSA